jgi:hypothetical protein
MVPELARGSMTRIPKRVTSGFSSGQHSPRETNRLPSTLFRDRRGFEAASKGGKRCQELTVS